MANTIVSNEKNDMSNKKIDVRRIIGFFACVLVGALDITAGILGMKAEEAQDHAKHVRIIFFECKGRSYEAFMLGTAAAALLVGAHLLLILMGFCVAPNQDLTKEKLSSSSKFGWFLFICLCVILLGAGGALALGAKSNYESKISCGLTLHNFLYYGGLGCFLHLIFSVGYYAARAGALSF